MPYRRDYMLDSSYRACVFERKIFKKAELYQTCVDNSIYLRVCNFDTDDKSMGDAARIFAEGGLMLIKS